MIRNWFLPMFAGFATAGVAWYGTLAATPYVLMTAAMNKIGAGAAVNSFRFGEMATADNQPIVRPSPDISYSSCVFDLSKGPVEIEVQPIPDHYWSVSVFDARTDVAAVRSDRDTAGKPAKLILSRHERGAPPGFQSIIVPYDRGIVLIRILLKDKSEFPAIDALRRKSTCHELFGLIE